jgi:L-2-hydroxyglutarate oxidase LhgO
VVRDATLRAVVARCGVLSFELCGKLIVATNALEATRLEALQHKASRPVPSGSSRAPAVGLDGSLIHDFLFADTNRMIHVLNAPSPAATAALPIGRMIAARALGEHPS